MGALSSAERKAGPVSARFPLRYLVTLSESIYFWWVVCLLGAAIYTWLGRHILDADGMNYLDMAVESLKSGPESLVNGLWSPLYPALISVALTIFHPAPAYLFQMVSLVNFVVFAFTLLAFTFFLRSFFSIRSMGYKQEPDATPYLIPFCFAVFIWFTMEFTSVSAEHPDLCVAAIVFLVAGICCRISTELHWKYFVALGLALGLGYYAKAAMFPSAVILFAILFALPPNGKRARLKVALGLLTFFFVSAPLVVVMSKRVGHLSTSEAGPLNYALYVNSLPGLESWHAGVNGIPEHPLRTVFRHPMVQEFATPVKGTYPLAYDPTYWYAGVRPYFDLRQQLSVIRVNLSYYIGYLSEMTPLVCGALMLCLLSSMQILRRRPDNLFWWFTLWPIAVCGMYDLVHVEARYVFGFLMLLSLSVYALLWQKVDPLAASAVLGTVLLALLIPTIRDVAKAVAGRSTGQPEYIRVGEALKALGVHPGDSIAAAGGYIYETGGKYFRESSACHAYYARYAGVRVIASIVDPDDGEDMRERAAPEFWHIDKETLARLETALAGTGVKAIVALDRPTDASHAGWRQVSGTPYSILPINVPGSEHPLSESSF